MNDFYTTLKKLISYANMTQKDFAKKSGMTEAAISRYVNGTRMPNMGALLRMKTALGCNWEDIMGE